jgi:RNA-directed DNA polymerase
MSPELDRIASRAKADRKMRFTALAHHLTEEFLRETWQGLNKRGASGVDGVSMQDYGDNLDANLHALVENLKAHRYAAPMVRRVLIPKAGNQAKTRPLGIPTVQDRLLQAAVARILGAIYEADFLDCSYGFRPARSAHQAVADVWTAIMRGTAQWVVEADIQGFFNHLDHEWLMRMLKLRIGDPWILRLVRKWLKAGILDHGQVSTPEEGTLQGGPLSPVLANVYLHYALDLWFDRVVRPRCRGTAQLIRFADDYVALFLTQADAEGFAAALSGRLGKFGLALAEEKTKLLPFGRRHWEPAASHSHHFDFLGFRHHLGTDRRGRMTVVRIPSPKSVRKFTSGATEWLRRNLHQSPTEQQRVLGQKLRGFYQYFALWHTTAKLRAVQCEVYRHWAWALGRRSQRARRARAEWERKPWFRLPEPKVLHSRV